MCDFRHMQLHKEWLQAIVATVVSSEPHGADQEEQDLFKCGDLVQLDRLRRLLKMETMRVILGDTLATESNVQLHLVAQQLFMRQNCKGAL